MLVIHRCPVLVSRLNCIPVPVLVYIHHLRVTDPTGARQGAQMLVLDQKK